MTRTTSDPYGSLMAANPCVLCDVAAGRERRAHIAFEDDLAVAVLATAPINPGQLLLFPRAHVLALDELGTEGATRLLITGQRLIAAIRKAGLRCEGVELHLSEGPTASVPHLGLQLLPRFAGDAPSLTAQLSWYRGEPLTARQPPWWEEAPWRLAGVWLPRREADDEELRAVARRIHDAYWSKWRGDPAAALAPRSSR